MFFISIDEFFRWLATKESKDTSTEARAKKASLSANYWNTLEIVSVSHSKNKILRPNQLIAWTTFGRIRGLDVHRVLEEKTHENNSIVPKIKWLR